MWFQILKRPQHFCGKLQICLLVKYIPLCCISLYIYTYTCIFKLFNIFLSLSLGIYIYNTHIYIVYIYICINLCMYYMYYVVSTLLFSRKNHPEGWSFWVASRRPDACIIGVGSWPGDGIGAMDNWWKLDEDGYHPYKEFIEKIHFQKKYDHLYGNWWVIEELEGNFWLDLASNSREFAKFEEIPRAKQQWFSPTSDFGFINLQEWLEFLIFHGNPW